MTFERLRQLTSNGRENPLRAGSRNPQEKLMPVPSFTDDARSCVDDHPYVGPALIGVELRHLWSDGTELPVLTGGASDDPTNPYATHLLVGEDVCRELTGLSRTQQKRARQDGLLPFYRHRGRHILYRVGDLYDYRDAMFVPVAPKPKIITRSRTPEHNRKIADGVRRAKAIRS